MPAQLPLGASANSSASTSFRVRPTTSSRFFRSASALRTGAPPPHTRGTQRRAQFLQQTFVSDDQQWLSRLIQQIEEVTAIRARINLPPVSEQLDASAASGRLEQTDAETVPQDRENLMQLVDAEPTSPEICQHEQFEELDRR